MKEGKIISMEKLGDAYGNDMGYSVVVHFKPKIKINLKIDDIVDLEPYR